MGKPTQPGKDRIDDKPSEDDGSMDDESTGHLRLVETAPASDPSPRISPSIPDGARGKPDSRPGSGLLDLADEQLVTLATKGEMGAIEALYRRHSAFAFNLAARIAGTTQDVEDTVHDGFLKAFDNLSRLRKPKAFRGWLGSIVVHAMRSKLRRQRLLRVLGLSRGEKVDVDCIASRDASPSTRAEIAQVYALLKTMSADDRIAWTLRFVEGHDLQTAADLACCSLATIKRRIRRAQQYLEAHFVGSTGVDSKGAESTGIGASEEATS